MKDPGRGTIYSYENNWDAHKIYGCVCDLGYTGSNCMERICPVGDDPLTGTLQDPNGIQRNEKQRVNCKATSGSFTLTFAGYTTEPIFASDSANTVTVKFVALPSVTAATITFGGITTTACTTIGNDISIEFTQDFGDGHGTCYTMEQLAKSATLNGETMAWTYGAVPNKKETWDYDMVQGCLCSSGWEGHDCSLMSCPTGDDPMTLGQQNEVQILMCAGNSGFFTLKFRDAATPQLPFNVPASSLESALESLATIGNVTVTYSTDTNGVTGSPACNAAGSNTMRIEFLTNFGNLPPLRWILDGALTLTINVDGVGGSVQGTKEEAVCSNRGICNHLTGVCRCAYGFTSSDSFGGEGDRGDCGYMEPLYITSAAQQANTV
ncbi:tenascin-like protein [Phytophthora cinnamomi]|uniref:tenascin-like protein n=1 Tax=Phytophthora cinnamomi TaxID=4785 RepID=UPI00355ABF47|nr:tenascin-like protein [Phytophthora cinnamomi]